jgi:hypothetical protein
MAMHKCQGFVTTDGNFCVPQLRLTPGLPDGICIFKPKIPIWLNLGVSCNGKCLYIVCPFGQFSGHLVYFMALWYIYGHLVYFPRFGILWHDKSGNPD